MSTPVLVALAHEIIAMPALARLVGPETVVAMAGQIVTSCTPRVIRIPPPTPPPSVGALRTWWRIPERERPSSGPAFRAAEWEACSRERWRYGDHEGAYEAMAEAGELVAAIAKGQAA